MKTTKELLVELREKHSELKTDVMKLIEKCNMPNYSKKGIAEELFLIYMELK